MVDASSVLPDGIPRKDAYDTLLQSAAFRRMDSFSEDFLTRSRHVLSRYMAKWGVENPLRSWSRQWEYPYVWGRVAEAAGLDPGLRILDAGSGATFLPFYIKHCFEETTVACCDSDRTLPDCFSAINGIMNSDVDFSVADIRTLPYEDGSFDLICCVSVLEHTRDYDDVLTELVRVLDEGGRLVITFDVSLDGTRDMRVHDLEKLLNTFCKRFRTGECERSPPGHSVVRQLSDPAILTTHAVNRELLSWRGPALLHRLKSSLANRRIVGWPPLLTVCCMTGRLSPDVPEE